MTASAAGLGAGAITTGVSAVYGFRGTSRCSDAIVDWNAFADNAAQERADTERAKLLAHLDELHRQARIAARADRCPNAKDIAARIRELDTTYYEAEVAHDGELARCLEQAIQSSFKKSTASANRPRRRRATVA